LWAAWWATPEAQKYGEKIYNRFLSYPDSGSSLSEEFKKYGIKVYHNDTPEEAEKVEKFDKRYKKMLGAM